LASEPIHILIIDGDNSYRLNLGSELKNNGYQVSMTSSANKALELFPQMPFQIIVADLGADNGNAGELIATLAEKVLTVPVILTAADPNLTAEEAARMGAADFMRKPLSTRDLMEKVRRVLGQGKSFQYFLNRRRSLIVVSWVGDLMVLDSEQLKVCLTEVKAANPKFVILNLHGFTGYDPLLAGELVGFQQAIRDTGSWLVLCGLEWKLREQLASKGLVVEGEILPTLKDALQYVLEIGMK